MRESIGKGGENIGSYVNRRRRIMRNKRRRQWRLREKAK